MRTVAYDSEALRKGIRAMQADIDAYEQVITELRRRIAEYENHLAVAEILARQKGGD